MPLSSSAFRHDKYSSDKTVKTRICIISDTHSHPLYPAVDVSHSFREPLPKADILLHCGDLTSTGKVDEHERTLAVVQSAEAELKLVIPGNHDLTLDGPFYKENWTRWHTRAQDTEQAREIWTGQAAREAGIQYLETGIQTFNLKNGAKFTVYSNPYTPEFCNWAFAYERDDDQFNPPPKETSHSIPSLVPSHPQIDIVMTHGPPLMHLSKTRRYEDAGCPHLLRAIERCRPRLHCFGHIHEGWGAERVQWAHSNDAGTDSEHVQSMEVDPKEIRKERGAYVDISKGSARPLRFGDETLLVNASIMDVRYNPINSPWVVDLDLPLREGNSK